MAFGSTGIARTEASLVCDLNTSAVLQHFQSALPPVIYKGEFYWLTSYYNQEAVLWHTTGATAAVAVDLRALGLSNCGALSVQFDLLVFSGMHNGVAQIWSSEGSAASTKLVATTPEVAAEFASWNNTLYFATYHDGIGRSNGTQASTYMLPRDTSLLSEFNYTHLVATSNGVFCMAVGDWNDYLPVLCRTDGITLNRVAAIPESAQLMPLGQHVLFSGYETYRNSVGQDLNINAEPWISDGTTVGSHLLRDVGTSSECVRTCFEGWPVDNYVCCEYGPVDSAGSIPRDFTLFNGKVLFRTTSWPAHLLWSTDGTASGTQEFLPGVEVTAFAAAGSNVFFANPNALSATDGTPAGTRDLLKLAQSQQVVALKSAADKLYFITGENTTGDGESYDRFTLWTSDGSFAGTRQLHNFDPGTNIDYSGFGSFATESSASSSDILFQAGEYNSQLWFSDGTVEGTHEITRGTGTASSNVKVLGATNSHVIFEGDDAVHGREPWSTDGSPGSEILLSDVVNGTSSSASRAVYSNAERLYFLNNSSSNPSVPEYALWKTDGSVAGTTKLQSWSAGQNVSLQFASAGRLDYYLVRLDNVTTPTLFRTDGTSAGSIQISENVYCMKDFGQKLLFSYDDGVHGEELWSTQGTPETTTLFKDINPGTGASSPRFSSSETGGYFEATSLDNGMELWVTDGSPEGTHVVLDAEPGTRDMDFFPLQQIGVRCFLRDASSALWITDGTASGTVSLNVACRVLAGTAQSRIVFLALRAPNYELWSSDGTADGTFKIRDDLPIGFFGPTVLQGEDEVFIDSEGVIGAYHRVWRSDGTPPGTVLVGDNIEWAVPHGNTLFANRGEQFQRIASNGTQADSPANCFQFGYEWNNGNAYLDGRFYFAAHRSGAAGPDIGLELWSINNISEGSCSYSITTDTLNAPVSGADESFGIIAGESCIWSASSNSDWVQLYNPTGIGSTTVAYKVMPNTGENARTAVIYIAGLTHTVTQAGVPGPLHGQWINVTQSCKASGIGTKCKLQGSLRFDNTSQTTLSHLICMYYLSDDLAVSADDLLVGTSKLPRLKGDSSIHKKARLKLPAGADPSGKNLICSVALGDTAVNAYATVPPGH